ncbi:MAG: glycoside hydrolase family 27 protein [Acutalibacteraceae bacterium]|nr:glycoside hydrolase family 27 protein [Acutalibacteraceae bacterium]
MIVNKPPMGWNSWNTFAKDINEELILKTADVFIESGLKDAGYEYVVIDDIWALKERDENGRLVPDPEKFPHGMKYVADYIHSKGLKFGMYSCAGYYTCAGYPGSFDYEWIDAATFAEWEIDFLKYDFCFHPTCINADVLYKRMALALANCGRDILFSACSWGAENTRHWIKETGAHMWRSTPDIFDSWESIKRLALKEAPLQEYNGRGCFNDMDMLVVGMYGKGFVGLTGCTDVEYRTHFSLWAMLNSPLMIGCDIRNMSDAAKAILTNKEVIAINQDPLCAQPFYVNNTKWEINTERKPEDPFYKNLPDGVLLMAKYLDGGDIAVGLFNFSDGKTSRGSAAVLPDLLGLPAISGKELEATELWSGETIRSRCGVLDIPDTEPHDCKLYRVKVVD